MPTFFRPPLSFILSGGFICFEADFSLPEHASKGRLKLGIIFFDFFLHFFCGNKKNHVYLHTQMGD